MARKSLAFDRFVKKQMKSPSFAKEYERIGAELKKEISVDVLLYKDGMFWVAQGAHYDLMAQASSKREVKKRFARTLIAQIQDDILDGREPLSNIQPPAIHSSSYICMHGIPWEARVR